MNIQIIASQPIPKYKPGAFKSVGHDENASNSTDSPV